MSLTVGAGDHHGLPEDTVLKRAVLSIVGLIALAFLLLITYFSVGATVFGPKTTVAETCEMVTGMTLAEAKTAVPNGSAINFMEEPERYDLYSEQKGEWICVCSVETDEDTVIRSQSVHCLD